MFTQTLASLNFSNVGKFSAFDFVKVKIGKAKFIFECSFPPYRPSYQETSLVDLTFKYNKKCHARAGLLFCS